MSNAEEVVKNISNVLFDNKETIPDGLYVDLMDKMKCLNTSINQYYEIVYYKPEIIQLCDRCDCNEKQLKKCSHNWEYHYHLIMKEEKIITTLTEFQLEAIQNDNKYHLTPPHDVLYKLNGAIIENKYVKNSKSDLIMAHYFIVKSWKKL